MPSVLIIGHGLVGACLAQRFSEAGYDVTVYDRPQQDSASRVAAGLITPITGKGMNPSERIADFFHEAVQFFGPEYYTETGTLRLFGNLKEKDKFLAKADRKDIAPWLKTTIGANPQDECIQNEFGGFEMSGGWVNTAKFLDQRQKELAMEGSKTSFVSEHIAAAELETLREDHDFTILSRGAYEFIENEASFLKKIRSGTHRSAKGEILTVQISDLNESRILNRNGWLMPYDLEKNLYRVGATFEWDELNVTPTKEGREMIEDKLRSLIKLPFKIVDHQAGIRPIVRKSHPFIEAIDSKTYVINGFGSKGTLYAPKASREFVEAMTKSEAFNDWYKL